MREHRIFQAQDLITGQAITLDENASNRIRQVLRLKPGQAITLFNGNGNDYTAELTHTTKQTTQVRVGAKIRHEQAPTLTLHLALGITRGERMEYSLQKAVELGVTTITPLFTQRTLVQLKTQKLQRRQTHWQGIIQHACEQSGRSLLPEQQPAQSFTHWITQLKITETTALLLDHQAEQSLAQIDRPESHVIILVGPEGGLTETERTQAKQQGFTSIRLGPRILRAETAPLAALAAIQMLWGDFG
jgi:16S rRNA (uracil1498-N3)-methyltransferase